MHRLAISMACVALLLGAPHALAQSPEPTRAPGQATAPSKGAASARGTRSAVRERQLTRLRERKPLSAEEQLVQELDTLWSSSPLHQGTTAVYVIDAVTGRPLYAVHEDQPLNPASNVKLIATATALDLLGPDWRYVTRVLGPTPSPEGVVHGDLYLLGSYDPTLTHEHIGRLARDMAAAGITRVEGDLHVGDGPGDELGRDSVHQRHLTIRVTGASAAGQAATVSVSPLMDLVRVEAQVKTVKSGAARISITSELVEPDDGPAHWRVVVSGQIGARRKASYRRNAPRTPLFTAHLLHAALAARGVSVIGAVRQAELADYVAAATTYLPVDLARHESAPLRELVARINKRSINDLADRLIMTVGAIRYGGQPTMKKGVQAMYEWLRDRAAIDPDGLHLDTGSGLSYRTELSARHIVRVLRRAGGLGDLSAAVPAVVPESDAAGAQAMASLTLAGESGDELAVADEVADLPRAPAMSEPERVFRESLAIAGIDGTLGWRFRGSSARGKVLAKTGTLTRVVALAGIVPDGEAGGLAFAIITNGSQQKRRNQVRRQHELMVEAMQRYLRARQVSP